jgi:deoxycytidylate deaminase
MLVCWFESPFWRSILSKIRIIGVHTQWLKLLRDRHALLRSACLSRQVGAALLDKEGNVIGTGTNEVPKAGGGVYGEHFDEDAIDSRCAFRETGKYCSNTQEQNRIIDEIFDEVPELSSLNEMTKRTRKAELRKSRVGDLIEFSRAVHAEMDALFSAARKGTSTIGTRLFVTTFPCHSCARGIVTAGVDEVQYIEPYRPAKTPVMRGSTFLLEPNRSLLWTTGYIPELATYPGREVPNPLLVEISRGDGDMDTILRDVMGLTKVNFNACIFSDGLPVTLRFAEAVGEILTAAHHSEGPPLPFRHYI